MSRGEPTLASYLDGLREIVDIALGRAVRITNAPALVIDVMTYPLMGGGKRLRPCLTLAVAQALGPRLGHTPSHAVARALAAACAVEMIHTYSLVHDDLPAMDDDALRRGRATTHVVYGDGLAILAGDGLLTEAFALLAQPLPNLIEQEAAPSAEARLRMIAVLAQAAGAAGMVGGQALDLAAAGRVTTWTGAAIDAGGVADMHARKTGALIRAAAVLGALAVDADRAVLSAIDDYARELGLAFQIVDDLLDIEGTPEALGKTAGKDEAAGKPTYPAVHGLEVSRRLARECVERAKAALASVGLGDRLAEIADWSLERRS